MRKFRPWIVLIAVSLGAAYIMRGVPSCAQEKLENPPDQPAPPTPATFPSSPDLGARYAAMAQDLLREKDFGAPQLKQSAALIMTAMKLDPAEPRYPRMLYEAMLQLRDNDGALNALKAFRSIGLPNRPAQEQPVNDQLMMVNYIDLTALQMETAEQRQDYYKVILDSLAPDPVKAHCAFRASRLARERGQTDLEDTLIGQALKLNPLNLDALRARLDHLTADGTPLERINVLQSMLKSNPAQPLVLYRLARELADAGLPEESLRHYTLSANLAGALGMSMGREFALGYASELYMMGQAQLLVPCKEILKQLLKQDPGDVESLLLQWLAERAGGAPEKDAAAKTAQQLLNASLNRVLILRKDVAGQANPATRPVESVEPLAIPDLTADIDKLKDEKFDDLRTPYAQAVTDLAWYLVFAGDQPAQAEKLLPTLKAMLTDKAPIVVRIEGWIFKSQQKPEPAAIKLKAVADQDVLAQAGTLLLWAKIPAEKQPAITAARKLLAEHPSGLLGALLLDSLKELNIKVVERDDAPAIKTALLQFPKDWFKIVEAPQAIYSIKAEMLSGRISYPFGEPMIARVMIKNISPYDITIGPEGVIRNELWFDVLLRGLVQQTLYGTAIERLTQLLVLKPGEVITQTVRLDQGQLAQVLASLPNPALTYYGQVRTNPRGTGDIAPGGRLMTFSSITERTGFGLNENSLRALTGQIATGSPTDRLRNLELMSAQIEQLRTQADNDQAKVLVTSFQEILLKTTDDLMQPVATWGNFLTAVHNPAKSEAVIARLQTDPDPARRILALLIASKTIPPDKQKEMALQMLQPEKDDTVKLFISGMLDQALAKIANPTTAPARAATRPAATTQPATIPGLETPRQP